VTNGKVLYYPTTEGFHDGVAYLNRLYSEGLIDQELFTQDRNMLDAKNNPPAGQPEIVGASGNWYRSVIGVSRLDHYPVLMPLKGPKGYSFWQYAPETNKGAKYLFEITKNCKIPEIALRWIDAIYDERTSLEFYLGPEGTRYTVNADGSYAEMVGVDGWTYALNDGAPGYTSDRVTARLTLEPASQLGNDDKLALAPYYPKEWWPPVSFTPEEINELAILRTDFHSISQQKYAQWVTQGGIEREYDAFVRQLNTMGLPRMLEIYQKAYNRYMGK
jgi:putative aldouronate transport system substrate-binding protein